MWKSPITPLPSPLHVFGDLVIAAGFLIGTSSIHGESLEAGTVLTTAAQVRSLTPEEASTQMRVRLKGVFMGGADPRPIAFVMKDETEGIYVLTWTGLVEELELGDVVEIEGVTDPAGYAPIAIAEQLRKVGHGAIPDPISTTIDDLYFGKHEAQWVELSGVVRSAVKPSEYNFTPIPTLLEVASGNSQITVEVKSSIDPDAYVDAEVEIRGICFELHNSDRQFIRPFIHVPLGIMPKVVKSPPEDPYSSDPLPVADLLTYRNRVSTDQHHRVHIRGTVLHHQPGSTLWLRDGPDSLRVETQQDEELAPGDQVDVLGFIHTGEYSPVLKDSVFRKIDSLNPPSPEEFSEVAGALINDGNLVRIKALLSEVRQFPDQIELILGWQGTPVRARLRAGGTDNIPAIWQKGSIVEVTGICMVEADEPVSLGGLWTPHSFNLLLRSTADLRVVQSPPWWNAERVVWLLSGFLILTLVLAAVLMWNSRRRLKEKELQRSMAEAEFTAILSERNRVAREIHDTLSQSLGAISVQLEIARMHANELGQEIRQHLATAHQLARSALAEARTSIWNMRSQVLEECDLGEALTRILHKLTDDSRVKTEVKVNGSKHRLSPRTENNLLRIGQEAITNAVKHAKANKITIILTFDSRIVHLSIHDDGIGFEAITRQAGERRSFGLVGIRERVEQMGGTLEIISAPGKGTKITVQVSD